MVVNLLIYRFDPFTELSIFIILLSHRWVSILNVCVCVCVCVYNSNICITVTLTLR